MIENHILEQLVEQSSWCQRNWDLSKTMPEKDIKTFKYIVKTCPSKQNRAFFKAVFIQDRNIIESIHDTSDSFTVQWDPYEAISNPQRDEDKSVGIAIGYLALAANILGYRTGVYNAQHRRNEIKEILNEGEVINMMGIGYHNYDKDIRQHHYDDRIIYPSFEKVVEVIDK